MAFSFDNATIDAFNADLFLAYRLESAVSDVIVDDSGDSNDGTNFGTDDATGKNNQCREWIAANSDYIQFPDDILSGLSNITINAWVYVDSLAPPGVFMSALWSSPFPFMIKFTFDGKFEITQGTTPRVSANSIVTTGSWQMYTFVKITSSSLWKIYKNGSFVEDVTHADFSVAIATTSGHDYFMGVFKNGGLADKYDGRMDELCIWDTNISAAAITALYNSGAGRFWEEIPETTTTLNRISGVLDRTASGVLVRVTV